MKDYTNPSISVIMPVFNAEQYLAKSVESILNQSYDNFELLVVNDNSTDNSLKILESYSDQRIRIICNENSMGVAASLNKLLDVVNGKYIARMDADDISDNNRLQKQLEYMEENIDIGILGGQINVIDEKGAIIDKGRKYPVNNKAIVRQLMHRSPIVHPTYFVRKEVYQKLSGYSCYPAAQDYDFLLRALNKGVKFANLSETVLLYRVHSDSISKKKELVQIFYSYQAYKKYKKERSGKVFKELSINNRDFKYAELIEESRKNIFGKVKRIIFSPGYRLGRYQLVRKYRMLKEKYKK